MKMTRENIQRLAARLMAERPVLSEKQSGDVELSHVHYKKGQPIQLVSLRVALLCGWPECEYIAPDDTVIHQLSEKGEGCWMTDMPCELVQMHEWLARHAKGHVLVGGLGLGILPRMVAERRQVRRVAVVERSLDVINTVWPQLYERLPAEVRGKIDVLHADIYDHAKLDVEYNVALLDTWQGTGEMVWTGDVVPLRRALAGKARAVHCWQEAAMHTQMTRAMFRVSTMKGCDALRGIPHYYAFWQALERQGVQRAKVDGAPDDLEFLRSEQAVHQNATNDEIRSMLSVLMHMVGSPLWERLYGKAWDEAVNYAERRRTGIAS